MHPNLSLTTSFPPHHPSTSINNRLPTSTTTSSASSPSATASSPFSFSPSFRPFNFHSNPHRGASPSSNSSEGSRSTSPLRLSALFLRRRPSKIDLALSAERTRCDGDAIERQGLELMEPRPVDPVDGSIFASLDGVGERSRASLRSQSQGQIHPCDSQRGLLRPRFVMGGIFEVMEGRD
ncbi:hypothetical protein CNMCM6106_005700 [Aspergillus hiratsukae]|uniref:Uncharacterized protein n=1 Tax=Aspergillus hiratsukae TaxID=1194566 RepID=A0A8H6UPN0_9EURO|nr:hypothetical protein CNMCM6106_005700 [Aspergillus hiratsukae]